MNIKFIGTGSGKASLTRFHSSILFSSGNYNLLVDTGDGVSKALLYNNISFNSINGILITHLHPDHFSGLPSLIVQMKLTGRINDLDVFLHKSSIDFVKNFIYSSYLFGGKMDFKIHYKTFEPDERINISDNLSCIARQNSHLDSYKKYDRLNALGFSCISLLFDLNNNNLLYTGDIGSKGDLYLFNDFKIDKIISEISHISMSDLLAAFRSQEIEELFLTHISDDDENKINELYLMLLENEKEKVKTAFDGLTIDV